MVRAVLILFVASLALPASPGRGQIVHLTGGFADRPGWSGDLAVDAALSGGNTELLSLGGRGRMQWLGARERFRLSVGGQRNESGGETTGESSVAQLRHNHSLGVSTATLAFIQRQHDPFQRLERRVLIGVGLRWEPLRGERFRAAVAAGPMLEFERIEGEGGDRRALRLSTIWDLAWTPNERAELRLLAYLQPLLGDVDDLRASVSATLSARLAGGFTLTWSYTFSRDSDPAPGVEKSDWKLRSGIGYSF